MFRLHFYYPGFTNKISLLIIGTNLGGFGHINCINGPVDFYRQIAQEETESKRKVFFDFYNLKCYFLVDSSWSMEDDRGTVENLYGRRKCKSYEKTCVNCRTTQSWKSTLIRKVIETLNCSVAGFETKKESKMEDETLGSPIYIHTIGAPWHYSEENLLGYCKIKKHKESAMHLIVMQTNCYSQYPRERFFALMRLDSWSQKKRHFVMQF